MATCAMCAQQRPRWTASARRCSDAVNGKHTATGYVTAQKVQKQYEWYLLRFESSAVHPTAEEQQYIQHVLAKVQRHIHCEMC